MYSIDWTTVFTRAPRLSEAGASAACRLLIFAAGSAWGTIGAIIAIDRVGKGIRTAPRDALISQRTLPAHLATAFGVHRALDAAGAMLGPVLAFAILAVMPGGFVVLVLVYLTLMMPASGGLLLLAAAVALLGVYYAATDGVLTAMAAAALPSSETGSGLAVLATATNVARLAASVTYGFLWTRAGIGLATAGYLLALTAAIV